MTPPSENQTAAPEIPPALAETVRRYFTLTQSAGPREWVPLIHPADIETFHAQLTGAAEILEPLGESDRMLAQAGVASVAELKAMAPFDLLCTTMERQMAATRKKAPGEIEKLMESLTIDRIVPPPADALPDAAWTVEYSFRLQVEDLEIDRRSSEEAGFTRTGDQWHVRLKPAMHSFATRARQQVEDFNARAVRDRKPASERPDEELEEFQLSGFRRVGDREVMIEARFSSAREFHEGLAAVRPLRRWGFIKGDGSWAIKPRFSDAKDFSDGLAPVAREEGDEARWGFIDATGRDVIPFLYDSAEEFAEGLAAVRKDDLWGFVDTKGELVIPHRYHWANNFDEGLAEVQWLDEEGEEQSATIDRTGKVVEDD